MTYPNTYDGASHFATDINFEVQRRNHFEVLISDFEELAEPFRLAVKEFNIPNISVDPIELKHGNETIYVAGGVTYADSTVTIYDIIGKDMEELLMKWFYNVFNPVTGVMGNVVNYKRSVSLFMYSPDGVVMREWLLKGCWPSELSFNALSNDDPSAKEVEMTLKVDKTIPIRNGKPVTI